MLFMMGFVWFWFDIGFASHWVLECAGLMQFRIHVQISFRASLAHKISLISYVFFWTFVQLSLNLLSDKPTNFARQINNRIDMTNLALIIMWIKLFGDLIVDRWLDSKFDRTIRFRSGLNFLLNDYCIKVNFHQ